MKLAELLAGRSDFASRAFIVEFIRNSKNFRPDDAEDLSRADALLIFSTSKQHTWLVSTNKRLYCILDDIRKDEPHINWSLPKRKLVEGRRFVAPIEVREKSPLSGTVAIGDAGRPWLYTKRLFSTLTVNQAVQNLVMNTMGAEERGAV